MFRYLYNDLNCAPVNINVLNVSENRMFYNFSQKVCKNKRIFVLDDILVIT